MGSRTFARVAQLSAEEAFRLRTQRQNHDHQTVWARFETELTKRTAEIEQRYRDELRTVGGRIKELESAALVAEELHALDVQLGHADSEAKLLTAQSQKEDLSRRVEDCLREVAQLRERNQELEGEMSKAARLGKLEEISFEEEARTWAGIQVSAKLARGGDYTLAYRDPSGAPLEPRIIVDNKDKATVSEGDIKKLIRDAKERRPRRLQSLQHHLRIPLEESHQMQNAYNQHHREQQNQRGEIDETQRIVRLHNPERHHAHRADNRRARTVNF